MTADYVYAECWACGADGDVELPQRGSHGLLACPDCNSPVATVGLTDYWAFEIDKRCDKKAQLQRSGALGTRKQSRLQDDRQIDFAGTAAELAACLILCPGARYEWLVVDGPNRGRDLPAAWTGLPKPVEAKGTKYRTNTAGYCLVRPPRNTPGKMLADYIDDSIYVLLHDQFDSQLFTLAGWCDRDGMRARGKLNPVPVKPGQRECWGIHWSRMDSFNELVALFSKE